MERFTGSFTQQEPLPDAAIAEAVDVLRSGRLHRYNLVGDDAGHVSALEAEYAAWQGAKYCLAVASGGQAMQIALRAAGVAPGDTILTNGFTLAPVPGAVAAVGGTIALVEIDENLRLDLDDFERKAATGARFLLLSHMRGHLCDMHRLMEIADRYGVHVIEDCAHTMGARWDGTRSGNFGLAGCFSTQTYKHINSGEGGFLTTDDPDLMARAVVLSGSYMLYERHGAIPPAEHFERIRLAVPNMSARMDHLRAAILRPQLPLLKTNVARWNARYDAVAEGLADVDGLVLPRRPAEESKVGSSIQFRLPDFSSAQCEALLAAGSARGVELKWFGAPQPVGFTSNHASWHYMRAQELPTTDRLMATLFDMRLPLTFSVEDCELIARLIGEAVGDVQRTHVASDAGAVGA